MSVEIESYGERRDPNGKWRVCDDDAITEQNYRLFGWLADVRNYSAVTPIAARRGLPEDVTDYVKTRYRNMLSNHSASWASMEELRAVDYEQVVEDRREHREVAPNHVKGSFTCAVGEGEKSTLREFLGEEYFEALDRMQADGAERIVFWFDN